jgi:hypothetical protein
MSLIAKLIGWAMKLPPAPQPQPRNRRAGATATAMRSADQEVFHDSSHPSVLILPTAAK